MKSEDKDIAALIKREMEIRRLRRQMELDQLQNSTVYKNLGRELSGVIHERMLSEPKK
jgi:hypothetical protein